MSPTMKSAGVFLLFAAGAAGAFAPPKPIDAGIRTLLPRRFPGNHRTRTVALRQSSASAGAATAADVSSADAAADAATPYPESPYSPLPPPPCRKSDPAYDFNRSVRRNVPVPIQNWLRDSGILRSVMDCLVFPSIPALARAYPDVVPNFVRLSSPFDVDFFRRSGDVDGETSAAEAGAAEVRGRLADVSYGDHPMQVLHVIEPDGRRGPAGGVVAFVHGGAWGSGRPWMYRLAALPFLERGLAAAIVGYRTYPDADADGQAGDVGRALEALAERRPDLLGAGGGITALVGHSTGAHISVLALLERAKARLAREGGVEAAPPGKGDGIGRHAADVPIDSFIGLSGVYCIPTHYEYESGWGVEELSPLKMACGPGEEGMIQSSAGYRLECILSDDGNAEECTLVKEEEECAGSPLGAHMPRMLFLHGDRDDTVPYTQSVEAAALLRPSLEEGEVEDVVLRNVSHVDTVLHLMVGGETREFVMDWLARKEKAMGIESLT